MWSSFRYLLRSSLEIELSLPSAKRTIVVLSSSEYVSYIVFFWYADIQNRVKH